jgi:prepilin-type N-terminal cleavage/methylation domain-containing protein
MTRKNGFTFLELMVALVILAIATTIAIPSFGRWLPNYRLKSAARDVYSNMQLAKLGAVRANQSWAIRFDPGTNTYVIYSDSGDGDWTTLGDNNPEKTVNLASYESGVGFGHGNAGVPIGTFGDNVTYSSPDNVAVFNARATSNGGYVYLDHEKNTTTYGIGTSTTGVIKLQKYNSSNNKWE